MACKILQDLEMPTLQSHLTPPFPPCSLHPSDTGHLSTTLSSQGLSYLRNFVCTLHFPDNCYLYLSDFMVGSFFPGRSYSISYPLDKAFPDHSSKVHLIFSSTRLCFIYNSQILWFLKQPSMIEITSIVLIFAQHHRLNIW